LMRVWQQRHLLETESGGAKQTGQYQLFAFPVVQKKRLFLWMATAVVGGTNIVVAVPMNFWAIVRCG
jgi:hypothetical protein